MSCILFSNQFIRTYLRPLSQHLSASLLLFDDFEGGCTSIPGLPRKKFKGLSVKPVVSIGIKGKSSALGMCVTPKECQSTTSSLQIFSSRSTHFATPFPPLLWLMYRPPANSSSSLCFVTQTECVANPARFLM